MVSEDTTDTPDTPALLNVGDVVTTDYGTYTVALVDDSDDIVCYECLNADGTGRFGRVRPPYYVYAHQILAVNGIRYDTPDIPDDFFDA